MAEAQGPSEPPQPIGTDKYMATAAHDLRNPIAVMRASAQMALRQMQRGDQEAAARRLQVIVDQTDRLSEVLEAFVDASRIEVSSLPLRPEAVDLREIVQAAEQRARIMVGEYADRGLEADVPEGCIGLWDRARVTRAVRALIENAFLYGDRRQPVRIVATRHGNTVRIVFSGGGGGPRGEETAHLFERFYRGHSAAEAGHSGSGLGLFTAQGIARAHGGDVCRAPAGPPDAFQLDLPLAAS